MNRCNRKKHQTCRCIIPSLKLTASSHLKIGWAPKGNDRIPTIHFEVRTVIFLVLLIQIRSAPSDHSLRYFHVMLDNGPNPKNFPPLPVDELSFNYHENMLYLTHKCLRAVSGTKRSHLVKRKHVLKHDLEGAMGVSERVN